MPVILAEKPSQAKAFADAFPKGSKKEGFMTIPACSIFPEGAMLTWGVGHLVELKSPAEYETSWKRWNLNYLPMIPESFQFKVTYKTKKQFQIVRQLLREADEIIIATDCDREGENIARSIIQQARESQKPTRRLWINSLEKEEVKKGFEQLQPGEKFIQLYEEAQARQISDWVVGMNASRLYTLLLKSKGLNHVFSVGRVQTPTLKLIYDRQKEIEQFVPEDYFEIKAEFKTEAGCYQGKTNQRYKTENEARAILEKHQVEAEDKATVQDIKRNQKRVKPPMLHSLSTLQTLANKKYKYSPSKTLEIVQSIYDEPLKLVTYPRTDTQHITKSEFAYVQKNIDNYQQITGDIFEPASVQPNKRYVDDKKVKEHHAIIPTKKIPTDNKVQKLRPDQKNIYFEIVKSVLAMFHYDYEYEETIATTDIKGLAFYSKGKVEKQIGWKELFSPSKGVSKQKQTQQLPELPPLEKGMPADAAIHIHKDKTKPPKPYTEGQLINMMKTCGQMVEEDEEAKATLKEVEGLGTEATRSNIIKTLIRQEYIHVQKNTVHVTKKGEILCQAVAGSLLSKPEMTAKWELFLKKIGEGEAQKHTFIQNTAAFTKKLVDTAGAEIDKLNISTEGLPEPKTYKGKRQPPIALCPSCKKGYIAQRQRFYGCSEYKNGCKQTFNRTILKKTITNAQIRDLCEKGETRLIKGFKGKRTFDAKLVFKNGKIEFSFPSSS